MIVCLCNAIREDELRAMARQGATVPVAAYKALGCEPICGCCLDCAQDIIDDERSQPAKRKTSSLVVTFPKAA